MPKTIPLSRGKFAIVDDEDFERVNQYKWTYEGGGYATRQVFKEVEGKRKRAKIMMHRFILGLPDGLCCDHANWDKLDNRRENLRPATHAQNMANRPKRQGCSSQYKGVSWLERDKRWVSCIKVEGRRFHLGNFSDPIAAALAYDVAAYAAWGEYAHVNFPEQLQQNS